MNMKLLTSALALSAALLLSGCGSTTGYTESEIAMAKMKQEGCRGGKCTGKSCKDCSKTIYATKQGMDETYK